MNLMHSVKAFGAVGDGRHDDAPAFQEALNRGGRIFVPAGHYLIGQTLRIGSHTRLEVHPQAWIQLADGAAKTEHDFLITNRDRDAGNDAIEIVGGVWDGNHPGNRRPDDLFAIGYSGHMLDFRNVRGLRLRHLLLTRSETYHVCLTQCRDFLVEHIRFHSRDPRPNTDGIHLGGFCEDGIIRHLTGLGPRAPCDDLVALNADDALQRVECRSKLRGPIRRIRIYDLRADQCHTFVRLLSVGSPIEDIDIERVRGGYTECVLNMDGARLCRVPLFDERDPQHANGVGVTRRVRLSDVMAFKAGWNTAPMLRLFQRVEDMDILDVRRDAERDGNPAAPLVEAKHIPGHQLAFEGLTREQAEVVAAMAGDAIEEEPRGERAPRRFSATAVMRPGDHLQLPGDAFARLRIQSVSVATGP